MHMVRMRYVGLGEPASALREFDALLPYVLKLRAMQACCSPRGPDDMALEIAVDGLETAAFHFTRRPRYYDQTAVVRIHGQVAYPGLGGPQGATKAFDALRPYSKELQRLQSKCSPFGRDYLALEIPKHALATSAYHFTGNEFFYAAKGDSAGPVRSSL
jgi:hypothetical protein